MPVTVCRAFFQGFLTLIEEVVVHGAQVALAAVKELVPDALRVQPAAESVFCKSPPPCVKKASAGWATD